VRGWAPDAPPAICRALAAAGAAGVRARRRGDGGFAGKIEEKSAERALPLPARVLY